MDETTTGTTEVAADATEANPWIAAFAALEPKVEEDPAAASGSDGGTGEGQDPEGTGGQEMPADNETKDGSGYAGDSGELDLVPGDDSDQDANAFAGMQGTTQEQIDQFENELNESIRNQAINDVAKEFIKRGLRNHDGVLGATLDDADICKRDEDGVPHFFNPETGQEFRGDNPRRQAQEWVDDYNKELARVFNETCAKYEAHLHEQSEPQIAVMKFAPKYEQLDDIRKGMFENVIQDYEITDDSGKVVGYSCDLDKALALVERQIAMIQDYAKKVATGQPATSQQQQQQLSGPALDIKASGGTSTSVGGEPPKSLAEAMERQQDALLAKLKK